MPNEYSATWFALFLQPIQRSQTESEIAFIVHHLPRPHYTSVVDLCCGTGRHARLLAARGYRMLGMDRDTAALAEAGRVSGNEVTYIAQDMRRFAELPGSFDAVLNLWQSFGYFDEATNRDVLRQINQKLAPKGRLILDIYHRSFFERHQGTRSFVKEGVLITESKYMTGNRLTVNLVYGDGEPTDTFDWRLYTPDELSELAEAVGFRCVVVCTGFDEEKPPSPANPRMQFVLEKKD